MSRMPLSLTHFLKQMRSKKEEKGKDGRMLRGA